MVHHREDLPPLPGSVAVARAVVAGMLREHGLEDVVHEALVVTSELVTNALQHAGTTFALDVDVDPDRLRIAVLDGDAASLDDVVSREAVARGAQHYGLRLVGALSDEWGTGELLDGKVVWAELHLPRA